MKKLIFILLTVFAVTSHAEIFLMQVTPNKDGYEVLAWGRLPGGQVKTFTVSSVEEIEKFTGAELAAEFDLKVKPLRFMIGFGDGSNYLIPVGTLTYIDFHYIENGIFKTRRFEPQTKVAADAVREIKYIFDVKPQVIPVKLVPFHPKPKPDPGEIVSKIPIADKSKPEEWNP